MNAHLLQFVRFSFVLFVLLFNWHCQSHYGYRAKIRVNQNPSSALKNHKESKPSPKEFKSDEPDPNLSATADSSLSPQVFHHAPKYNQEQLSIREKSPASHSKKNKTKALQLKKNKAKPPINYYAKRSLFLGLISFFAFPLLITAALGPLALFLGLKARKEIKNNQERGKGMATIGLILGAIVSISILVALVFMVIDESAIEVFLLLAMSLLLLLFLLNLLVYYSIINSRKNPKWKVVPEKPNHERNRDIRTFFIVLVSLLVLVNLVLFVLFNAAM
ncbi:MAG: DUF4190 domain-containing protein [Bacteroidia bacterium]